MIIVRAIIARSEYVHNVGVRDKLFVLFRFVYPTLPATILLPLPFAVSLLAAAAAAAPPADVGLLMLMLTLVADRVSAVLAPMADDGDISAPDDATMLSTSAARWRDSSSPSVCVNTKVVTSFGASLVNNGSGYVDRSLLPLLDGGVISAVSSFDSDDVICSDDERLADGLFGAAALTSTPTPMSDMDVPDVAPGSCM